MNRLLQRQIKRTLGKEFDLETLPENIQDLLRHVDTSYDEFNKEHALLDNMLEISSSELTQVNRLLKKENIEKITLLEKKFRTMFDRASDGIAIIKDHRFTECNASIANMFGYELDKFLGINVFRLMPTTQPNGRSSVREMVRMLKKAAERMITFEWVHTKSSGDEFWVEITLSPMEINQEKFLYGTWRDISDRKKVEQEIKELNATLASKVKREVEKNREKDKQLMRQSRLAQMGEMMSMIAHQWRQPLAAISATSATIELKASFNRLTDDVAMEKAQNISNYAQHLSATIDDFRNFFKPDKAKKEITYDELVRSVLGIIEVPITTQNIQLHLDLNCHKGFRSYPNELKQVVLNLVKNAEDALHEKAVKEPYIKITTYPKEGRHILEVSDNGEGIPEEIIESVFDPYFSTKKAKDGTGLGLYMSKMIIEEHCGGELSVYNSGDGAVFKISLEGSG
ncbi:MAG: PAS domain-containing sensor histidine kinase [Campylobacterota bacterium]